MALNALELAADARRGAVARRCIGLALIEDAVQQRALLYDKAGDAHYDTISAFIKSVRGSDPDAAVYWLARMLESGEDLMFIARRLVILAGEDVGLADPQALPSRSPRSRPRIHRHARGDVPADRGDAVPGDGAQVQLGRPRLRRRDGRRARDAQRPGPAAPAQRRHGPDARPGLRPRLPLQPRLCRGRSAALGAAATCPKTWRHGASTSPATQGFEATTSPRMSRASARSATARTLTAPGPADDVMTPPLDRAGRDAASCVETLGAIGEPAGGGIIRPRLRSGLGCSAREQLGRLDARQPGSRSATDAVGNLFGRGSKATARARC